MKKIIAAAVIAGVALSLSGCSAPKPREFEALTWASDMKNALEEIGITCDTFVEPAQELSGTTACNETVMMTYGGLILDANGEDKEGVMASLADEFASKYEVSCIYGSNWMFTVSDDADAKKIADGFHGTIVKK